MARIIDHTQLKPTRRASRSSGCAPKRGANASNRVCVNPTPPPPPPWVPLCVAQLAETPEVLLHGDGIPSARTRRRPSPTSAAGDPHRSARSRHGDDAAALNPVISSCRADIRASSNRSAASA